MHPILSMIIALSLLFSETPSVPRHNTNLHLGFQCNYSQQTAPEDTKANYICYPAPKEFIMQANAEYKNAYHAWPMVENNFRKIGSYLLYYTNSTSTSHSKIYIDSTSGEHILLFSSSQAISSFDLVEPGKIRLSLVESLNWDGPPRTSIYDLDFIHRTLEKSVNLNCNQTLTGETTYKEGPFYIKRITNEHFDTLDSIYSNAAYTELVAANVERFCIFGEKLFYVQRIYSSPGDNGDISGLQEYDLSLGTTKTLFSNISKNFFWSDSHIIMSDKSHSTIILFDVFSQQTREAVAHVAGANSFLADGNGFYFIDTGDGPTYSLKYVDYAGDISTVVHQFNYNWNYFIWGDWIYCYYASIDDNFSTNGLSAFKYSYFKINKNTQEVIVLN